MKRCPKCLVNYSDNTLEFCLEDGARLISLTNFQNEAGAAATATVPNKPNPTIENTVNLPLSKSPPNQEFQTVGVPKTSPQANLFEERIARPGNKVFEIAPLVISLAHNWWQWLYLNNQYYTSFSSYFLSANFLMWLLLLVAGAAVGLISLKRSSNKGFAITSLVILSVNLLLFLVPKR